MEGKEKQFFQNFDFVILPSAALLTYMPFSVQ